jgi:rod shape determining protein RodA
MFDRRLATHFDWGFVAVILGMALLGILTIYSANALAVSAFRRGLYLRQMTWVGVGAASLVAACLVSYRALGRFSYVIFGASVLLLAMVLVIGKAGLGAHRWIRVGGFAFQPSEFASWASSCSSPGTSTTTANPSEAEDHAPAGGPRGPVHAHGPEAAGSRRPCSSGSSL